MERVEPGRPMNKAFKALAAILMAFCLVSVMATAQQTDQNQSDQKQKKDDIPDAPSASRPFPGNLPPSSSAPPPSNQPRSDSGTPGPNQAPPTEGNPASPPDANSLPEPTYAPGVAPPMNVKTVPEGGATQERGGRRKRYFVLTASGKKTLEEGMKLKLQLYQGVPDFSFKPI